MKHIFLIVAALGLSACSTVKMPNFDLKGLADFRDEKIKGDYPKVADAPGLPTDVRSAAEWDEAAERLLVEKNGYEVPGGSATSKSNAEIEREFQELEDEVHAYKADDPS